MLKTALFSMRSSEKFIDEFSDITLDCLYEALQQVSA
jgi:hypothetical protein